MLPTQSGSNPFSEIPIELVEMTTNFLSLNDCFSFSRTCKYLHNNYAHKLKSKYLEDCPLPILKKAATEIAESSKLARKIRKATESFILPFTVSYEYAEKYLKMNRYSNNSDTKKMQGLVNCSKKAYKKVIEEPSLLRKAKIIQAFIQEHSKALTILALTSLIGPKDAYPFASNTIKFKENNYTQIPYERAEKRSLDFVNLCLKANPKCLSPTIISKLFSQCLRKSPQINQESPHTFKKHHKDLAFRKMLAKVWITKFGSALQREKSRGIVKDTCRTDSHFLSGIASAGDPSLFNQAVSLVYLRQNENDALIPSLITSPSGQILDTAIGSGNVQLVAQVLEYYRQARSQPEIRHLEAASNFAQYSADYQAILQMLKELKHKPDHIQQPV